MSKLQPDVEGEFPQIWTRSAAKIGRQWAQLARHTYLQEGRGDAKTLDPTTIDRSEERRVGKEC